MLRRNTSRECRQDPAGETIRGLTRHRFVVGRKRNSGRDATMKRRVAKGLEKSGSVHFSVSLDDTSPRVGGSAPKPVYKVPSEVVVCDLVCEASVHVLLVLEDVTYGQTLESSVNEHLSSESDPSERW